MDESKWIGTSMTFWGIVVTLGAAVLPMLGAAIDGGEVVELRSTGSQAITAVAAFVGALIAVIGRARAGKEQITVLPTPAEKPFVKIDDAFSVTAGN